MATTQRVTITLPTDILAKAREMNEGNLSQLITTALKAHFEQERKRKLREELVQGYKANAEEALAIAEEWRYVDYETTMKYVPPSPELETKDATELSTTR